jgi:hypothetical protein
MKNLFDSIIYNGFFSNGNNAGGGASGGNVKYQSGYRLNSSGEQIDYVGYSTSDYISCELNNVVYLLNIYMESGVENAGNLRIAFYDSNKVHLGQTNATGAAGNLDGKHEADDGSLSQFTVKSFTDCDLTNVKYIRLCSTKLDGDSVVIVTSGGGSGGGDTGGDDLAIKIIERTIVDEPLPEGLTKIGYAAFGNCKELAITHLPETITFIDVNAFDTCRKLALTSLPKGLTFIGNYAFSGCWALPLTSLPDGLTSMGAHAFSNCKKLTLTSLPDGLTSIPWSAFNGCTSLTLPSLHKGITSVDSLAFNDCTGLTNLTFEGTPVSIANNAFQNCTNLLTINVPWAEGEVANAPWGATNATINYNYTGE